MKLAIVAAAIVAAFAPATARANDLQRAGRYITTARAAWPSSPCAGRERFIFQAAITNPVNGADDDGLAYPSRCLVVLRTGLRDARLCDALTHELGHLAGAQHAASGIMSPTGDPWPPCTVAVAAVARQAVRATLPARERGASISCSPYRYADTRCVTRWRGYSQTWRVPLL